MVKIFMKPTTPSQNLKSAKICESFTENLNFKCSEIRNKFSVTKLINGGISKFHYRLLVLIYKIFNNIKLSNIQTDNLS